MPTETRDKMCDYYEENYKDLAEFFGADQHDTEDLATAKEMHGEDY